MVRVFSTWRRIGPAFALLAALLFAALAAPPAMAQDRDVDFSEFYEALEPHGQWLQHRKYGYVWSPDAAEDDDWRPYSRGHWAPTEEHGWYWVSDEPFGWAVYHYGRWADDEQHGWIWIPGSEWAPAWVAWRDSDDYIGWAPLPPEAKWRGDALEFSSDYYNSPRFAPYWIFVAPRYLSTPGLYRHAAPRSRNATILGSTRYVTDYRRSDRYVFNRGIDPRLIERRISRPLPFIRVAPGHSRGDHGFNRGDRSVVQIYRPTFRPQTSTPVVPRIAVRPHGDDGRGAGGRGNWRFEGRREDNTRGSHVARPEPIRPEGRTFQDRPTDREGHGRGFGRAPFDGRDGGRRAGPDDRGTPPVITTPSATGSAGIPPGHGARSDGARRSFGEPPAGLSNQRATPPSPSQQPAAKVIQPQTQTQQAQPQRSSDGNRQGRGGGDKREDEERKKKPPAPSS